MQPFRPNGKQTLTRYYEVPVDILEDAAYLLAWARSAVTLPTAQLALPFTGSLQRDDRSGHT